MYDVIVDEWLVTVTIDWAGEDLGDFDYTVKEAVDMSSEDRSWQEWYDFEWSRQDLRTAITTLQEKARKEAEEERELERNSYSSFRI